LQFQKTSSGGNVGGGGKIITPFPQDNIHGVDLPDTMGGKFGGGVDNLSHSLSGSSAVQRNKGKPESSGI
jgi:hypothetical protein